MISSKDLIAKTGISRATLNNYIGLGILSKPELRSPESGGRGPRTLGYFPADSIERLEAVDKLKREGKSMTDIAKQFAAQHGGPSPTPSASSASLDSSAFVGSALSDANTRPNAASSDLRVTIDEVGHPAYMVNQNFELTWINREAQQALFGGTMELQAQSESRNLFRLLLQSQRDMAGLLNLNMALAKNRLTPEGFANACRGFDARAYARLQCLYAEVEPITPRPMIDTFVDLPGDNGMPQRHHAYVSLFREGVFVVLAPETESSDALLDLLCRRDEMIRGLLRRRLPVLTNLAVLVADLQSSVKICSELPPEEYFELINEIWTAMAPIFRRHCGTCGKHVGDGMVYYFFPQPDSDYLANALACARDIRQEMQRLSKAWQLRKNWLNELYLNTGITEGQEWLGTYQSSTGIEFVVLGDTINQAARISDLARFGGIWATKALIGKLPAPERERVVYGVRRKAPDGRDLFVPSSYSQVATLIEQDGARMEKLRDIATLAITEIIDVKA